MLALREPSRTGRERVSSHVPWRALTGLLRLRRTIIFLHFGAISCMSVLFYSFTTWGPALLFRSHGLSGGIVGITWAWPPDCWARSASFSVAPWRIFGCEKVSSTRT
jgi:hypothetical protein